MVNNIYVNTSHYRIFIPIHNVKKQRMAPTMKFRSEIKIK